MERNKFEEMLERLVNEDTQGAKELFHDIVVEKSRNIYESLLEGDMDMDDEEVDESFDIEEDFDLEEDFGMEEDNDMEGPEMDMEMDMDDEGGMEMNMDGEGGMELDMDGMDDNTASDEDRLDDLERGQEELEDLLDELQQQLAGELDGDDDMDGDGDDMGDDMGGDETDDLIDDVKDEDSGEDKDGDVEESVELDEAEEEDEDEDDEPKNESQMMASYLKKLDEYTQKTGGDTYNKFAPGGDNGDPSAKSAVAGNGKSPELKSSGTAGNLNQGATADTKGTGGKVKGELKTKGSQVNMVKGGAKGSQLNKVPAGHGAEKKGPATAKGQGTSKQFLKPGK